MASNIKIKRSETLGNPAVLGAGELAYSSLVGTNANGGDRLYIGTGTETGGNAVNHVVIGGKYFTDIITAATDANTASTLVKRDASGNFIAGTITATLAGNASTATKLATARTIAITGDIAYTSPNFDGSGNVTAAATLASSGVTASTYGSATAIPVITVDAKGRITVATTAAISSTLTITDGTISDNITIGTDTLKFAAGTGVVTTVTDNQVSFAIGQPVSTTSNVTFNDIIVSGNLTVNGTTTTVNSTAVAISDINLTLAKDATTAAQADGAGLTVTGANATLTYNSTSDRWNFNKDLVVGIVYGNLSGNATTATTATTALTVDGGDY